MPSVVGLDQRVVARRGVAQVVHDLLAIALDAQALLEDEEQQQDDGRRR